MLDTIALIWNEEETQLVYTISLRLASRLWWQYQIIRLSRVFSSSFASFSTRFVHPFHPEWRSYHDGNRVGRSMHDIIIKLSCFLSTLLGKRIRKLHRYILILDSSPLSLLLGKKVFRFSFHENDIEKFVFRLPPHKYVSRRKFMAFT